MAISEIDEVPSPYRAAISRIGHLTRLYKSHNLGVAQGNAHLRGGAQRVPSLRSLGR